jgi:hypothetical protein
MISLEAIRGMILGGVALRTQLLAVVGSIFLLLMVIRLIRQEKLKPGYSIGWFVVVSLVVVFAVFSRLLSLFAELLGIAYAPAAFLLILVAGLFLLTLHFSVLITWYDRKIRDLAQEQALLREELRRTLKR